MKSDIDKLSVALLAGIAACLALAFVLPAMAGYQATQSVTTGQATTIELKAQDNTTDITGWTLTGAPGSTNSTPVNSNSEIQVLNTPWKSVVLLNNTASVNYKIIINAAEFSDTGVAQVSNEKYNVTATDEAPADDTEIAGNLTAGTDVDTGVTITADNGQKALWLKLTFGSSAAKSATSSFSVLAESP